MANMQVGQSGKKLFQEWEGLELNEYLDSGGAPTIVVGHLMTRSERMSGKIIINGKSVVYRKGLTVQQCWDLLDQDLDSAEGNNAFRDSTLLKMLNAGHFDQVPTQLRRWIRDNGKIVKGLINRREKEISLWNTPI